MELVIRRAGRTPAPNSEAPGPSSAAAILANLRLYIHNLDYMNLDAGDSRYFGRSFPMEEKIDDPQNIRQWFLYVSIFI